VKVGPLDPADKSLRVIEEGLKRGEWVVVQGRQRARPGIQVDTKRIAQPENPAASPDNPPAKKRKP
jgi:hypothetical protein